ncbi:MAG: hypothetical protein J2P15_16060, partial [Micromonosporaceae bacterium]|nr:hypothetical protein [Micromonosporaceae bacterium]
MRLISARTLAGAVTTGLALGGAIVAATQADASETPHAVSPHAVFVQTQNTAGNTIVGYRRGADGSLTRTGSYPTGGTGGQLNGSVVDHTASQGSLILDRWRQVLYAVNAGSDTVTVFAVHGDRLTRLQVIGSGGEFPVSITVHGNLVYVLNARAGGSIQGYRWAGPALVAMPAWHRALGLDPTATPEFTHTPGQVAFTPNGSQLMVTTKAGSDAIDVYRIAASGAPAASPTVNAAPGTTPFGVTFDPRGRLVAALTGPNAVASFTINRDGTLTQLDQEPTGQAATCWVVADGGLFYASNAGSGTVSGYAIGGSG